MIIKKLSEIALKEVQMEGAKGASVQVVFGPADDAPNFAMRVFTLGPGGQTPFHEHPFEHEVLVLSGNLAVAQEKGETQVEAGNAILVQAGEKHCFRNLSDREAGRFLCMVPVEFQK